jgi:hypothetical protein
MRLPLGTILFLAGAAAVFPLEAQAPQARTLRASTSRHLRASARVA